MAITFGQDLDDLQLLLKLVYGLVPVLVGIDKFFNIIVDWGQYLAPSVTSTLGLSAATVMMVVGAVEILAGLLVLTKWTREGAYLVSFWLILVAVNLVLAGGFLDIALRDVGLAAGAFTLARLTEMG